MYTTADDKGMGWFLLVMGSQNMISISMCTTADDKDMGLASVGNGFTEYDQYLNVHYSRWQGHGVGFCW